MNSGGWGPSAQDMRTLTFGGGSAASVFSPVVMVIILLAGILILVLPREKAIVPFFMTAIIIPMDQVLVIGSLHFPMLRVLILFGLARILKDGNFGKAAFSGGFNKIDKAMIVMTVFTLIDGILLWRQVGQVVYQLGMIITYLGSYTVVRYLIRNEVGVMRALRAWAYVAFVLALVMIGEHVFKKNLLFLAIGGARASVSIDTMVRDGSLRARGSFLHPILAGTFGGFGLPLMVGLWWKSRKDRPVAILGAISSFAMGLAASSSTAMMGMVGGLIGLFFWGMRKNMRTARRWLIGVLAIIQVWLAMRGRFIWHVIVDVDFTGSSSSWHRFMLVDECVRHFLNWALVGTQSYGSWGWEMWDLSDQYVAIADVSGLIPVVAFMVTIVMAFKYIGWARKMAEGDRAQEHFIWAIGASVFANVIAFIGISYFDQTIVGWYAVLAMVCAVSLPARTAKTAPSPAFSGVYGARPAAATAAAPEGVALTGASGRGDRGWKKSQISARQERQGERQG
jgi:hypothetical protein